MHLHLNDLRLHLVRRREERTGPRPAKIVLLEARRQARRERTELSELPPPRTAA